MSLSVRDHKFFKREGKDIFLNVPVTIGEALLGARIEIPAPDGKVALRIPAGVRERYVIQIQRQGLSFIEGSGQRRFPCKGQCSLTREDRRFIQKTC